MPVSSTIANCGYCKILLYNLGFSTADMSMGIKAANIVRNQRWHTNANRYASGSHERRFGRFEKFCATKRKEKAFLQFHFHNSII
jgi:hypothetical protein